MTVLYRERLAPPVWVWVVAVATCMCIGFTFWVPLGLAYGAASFGVTVVLALWWLAYSSPEIQVTNQDLRVGRAHIDLFYTGIVASLDEQSTTDARGVNADPRAYTVIRPLSAKEAITVEVCDDEDPHPYWMISTKNPEAFGRALVTAQANS